MDADTQCLEEVDAFIAWLETKIEPIEEQICELRWNFAISGDEKFQPQIVEKEMQLHSIYSSKENFEKIQKWRQQAGFAKNTHRILEHLYRLFLARQEPKDLARKKAELDVKLAGHYANFRSLIDNKELTVNDIKQILHHSDDNECRKKTWEASKQIGPIVKDLILERVGICNQIAAGLGFRDYYALQLELQEIDEDELYSLLGKLDNLTKEPFKCLKSALDAKLAKRFGLKSVEEIRPWHYNDPFFQDAPSLTDLDLDPFFCKEDLEDLTLRSFDHVGLDIRQTMKQSDLDERAGKDQHAFCLMMGRRPDRVKILCNCRNNAFWMSVMLHEFGHGVYDQNLDPGQNYFLRDVAHINTTEAIAMLFGRLTHNQSWLEEVLGMDPVQAAAIAPLARKELNWHMLLFSRWVLVMSHFEKSLYANPNQDLNSLWWDIAEKFQFLHRPEKRNKPDWATKIHIALNPVYYHNYILGEMTASQIQHYIENQLGHSAMISHREQEHGCKKNSSLKERFVHGMKLLNFLRVKN